MKHITLLNILVVIIFTSCSPVPTALPTMVPTVIPTNTANPFATPTQIPFDQAPFEYVSFYEPEKLWSENAGRISLEDHYLYVEDIGSRILFAYDLLTDPQLTTPIFQIDYGSPLFIFDVHKDIIYEGFPTGFQLYSIADPSNLVLLQKHSYVSLSYLSYRQILATEDFVFLIDGRSRLDVSNNNGDLISRINFSHPDYKTQTSPIYYSNGYLYIAVSRTAMAEPQRLEQSFRIYKTDDLGNLFLVNSYALPGLEFNTAYSTRYTIIVRDDFVFLTWWASPFAFVQEATDNISGEIITLDVHNPNKINVISRGQLFESVYDSTLVGDYFFFITDLGIRTINLQQIYYPYESTRKDLYQIEYGRVRGSRGNVVNFNETIYVSTSEYELYRIEYTIQK